MSMARLVYGVTVIATLLGCGGGGGGGGDSSAAPTMSGQITCPDGSLSAKVADCPVVTTVAPVTLSTVDPAKFGQGLTVQFNGTIDPKSLDGVTLVLGDPATGTNVAGKASVASNGKDVTFTPTQRLAYGGQKYDEHLKLLDSLGRVIDLHVPFSTVAMSCVDTTKWQNPATFSNVYQDCVAPVAGRALVDQTYNKVQDDTCAITVGTPLSTACKGYMANGTFLLADTGVVVNSHNAMWLVYVGLDGVNHAVLLDVGDAAHPVPVGMLALPSPLVSVTGNPLGLYVSMSNGAIWELMPGAGGALTTKCYVGC